jgi:hypothetical protein
MRGLSLGCLRLWHYGALGIRVGQIAPENCKDSKTRSENRERPLSEFF